MIITGAIFDMDGTLLDSMDYWSRAADEFLLRQGITPLDNTSDRFLSLGMKNWYEFAKEAYSLDITYDVAYQGIYDVMNEKYNTCVKVKDGVIEMLKALSKKGVKMCLATATDRSSVEGILKRLGIDKYFSKIFTSSEVGLGKRFPLIYERALEYLGTPRETTYVFEDALYAMKTAFENGFRVVGVYDKNVKATREEIESLCHIYLDENSKYKLELE
ncbi:MAG: HAD family phosphatase [Clostridia bacterium]|nr:HAD family phosphatase [Clostridia bacterium]